MDQPWNQLEWERTAVPRARTRAIPRVERIPPARRYPHHVLFVVIGIILLVIYILYPSSNPSYINAVHNDITGTGMSQLDTNCLSNFGSRNHSNHFPLPHQIDGIHEAILLQRLPHRELLLSIHKADLAASSALAKTVEMLVGFVAQIVCFSDHYGPSLFVDDIQKVRTQLSFTLGQLRDLLRLYSNLEGDFSRLQKESATEFAKGQLNSWQEVFVAGVATFTPWLWDANEAYWFPFKKLERENQEATAGYATLTRDIERLQLILNELTVLDRKLELLQISLPREDGLIRWFKAQCSPKLTGSWNSQQVWWTWLSQQGSQFEDSWKKLLASVTGEEPGIKIQSEWNQGLLLRDPARRLTP